MAAIDLNSDLGESFGAWTLGDDDAMLRHRHQRQRRLRVPRRRSVDSCGGCARRPSRNGVAIGAQVTYPDLAGFGRRFMDIDPDELRDVVLYQLGALDGVRPGRGSQVAYVKPHGALYHATIADAARPEAVVDGVARVRPVARRSSGCRVGAAARPPSAAGLEAVPEAFADRAYLADGRLVPRREPGSGAHRPGRRRRAGGAHGDRRRRSSPIDGTVDRRSTPGRSASTATRPGAVQLAPGGPGRRSTAAGVAVHRVHAS